VQFILGVEFHEILWYDGPVIDLVDPSPLLLWQLPFNGQSLPFLAWYFVIVCKTR